MCLLGVKAFEAAVDEVIGAGDERRLVRAKVERERCDFVGFSHSPYGLGFGKLFKDFLFPAGVVRLDKSIDEGRVYTRR